jgi:hypothetical protein
VGGEKRREGRVKAVVLWEEVCGGSGACSLQYERRCGTYREVVGS